VYICVYIGVGICGNIELQIGLVDGGYGFVGDYYCFLNGLLHGF
jgi:hypothetical protein